MATVPRGGSALARIAGNCLAAMAHTMGCGAVAAGGVPAIARNRPQPSNAVGRVRCRWHRHRRPLRPGIHDSLPWKKTPPRRPVRPPRDGASLARLRRKDGTDRASSGRSKHPPPEPRLMPPWIARNELFSRGSAWMTGFQAQVVHRHARHTAPSRGKPLIRAMAARVCWETRACRRLHCPE